jgi:hypothetical protein
MAWGAIRSARPGIGRRVSGLRIRTLRAHLLAPRRPHTMIGMVIHSAMRPIRIQLRRSPGLSDGHAAQDTPSTGRGPRESGITSLKAGEVGMWAGCQSSIRADKRMPVGPGSRRGPDSRGYIRVPQRLVRWLHRIATAYRV